MNTLFPLPNTPSLTPPYTHCPHTPSHAPPLSLHNHLPLTHHILPPLTLTLPPHSFPHINSPLALTVPSHSLSPHTHFPHTNSPHTHSPSHSPLPLTLPHTHLRNFSLHSTSSLQLTFTRIISSGRSTCAASIGPKNTSCTSLRLSV